MTSRVSREQLVARMRPSERRIALRAAKALDRGDDDAAIEPFERLRDKPLATAAARHFALYGLAIIAHHACAHEWAVQAMEEVVAREPGLDIAWYNLGTFRQHLADYAGAEAAFRRAADLAPAFAQVRTNPGNALLGQGRHAEAIAVFEEALRHKTGDKEALYNRAHALVATGRWLEGWACYEARWALPGFFEHNRYHHPSEAYELHELHGKRVIVMEEQGYGDLLMTLRFDGDLKAMGATEVTWAVRPEMVRLVRSAGLQAVDIEQAGSTVHADFNIACMSLMRVTRCIPARVPKATGYLHATPHPFDLPGLKVGICWEGSKLHRDDRNRSLPKNAMATLQNFHLGGVSWIAMCRDGWRPEMADAGLTNGLDGVTDWQDTADRIAGLDLLITVDTAVAHLAGALNVPVWILLAAVPDMRWGLQSNTTPWYRSARLYRQVVGREWGPVIELVGADLQRMTEQRKVA